jgi:hypothetical protein
MPPDRTPQEGKVYNLVLLRYLVLWFANVSFFLLFCEVLIPCRYRYRYGTSKKLFYLFFFLLIVLKELDVYVSIDVVTRVVINLVNKRPYLAYCTGTVPVPVPLQPVFFIRPWKFSPSPVLEDRSGLWSHWNIVYINCHGAASSFDPEGAISVFDCPIFDNTRCC